MTSGERSEDDITRRFDEIVNDMAAEEMAGVVDGLLGPGGFRELWPEPTEQRRPPLPHTKILTVRIDLQHATPPI